MIRSPLRRTPMRSRSVTAMKRVPLRQVSKKRRAYLRSPEHIAAYGSVVTATGCLPHQHGAPGKCFGPLTPHHILTRSKAGDLAVAELYPVISACQRVNGAMQDDPETREWATTHSFMVDGRSFPFLITDAFLTAEREGVRL